MEPFFGIVIPTKSRCRFLPKVIDQVKAQDHDNWRCVIVCDGPCRRAGVIFDEYTCGDARFELIERASCANDWGYTPRGDGLARLRDTGPPPDYIVFWDDDNAFHPDALTNIRNAIAQASDSELIVVPIRCERNATLPRILPDGGLTAGGVDTANLVVRFSTALQFYGGDSLRGRRGTDPRFFQRLVDGGCRFHVADIPPIGLYDGLRPLATLRWRLGIPRLGLSRWGWYIPIQQWLRG